MRQRSVSFLVVWLLIFNGEISGQNISHSGEKNINANSQIIKHTINGIVRNERDSGRSFSKYFITTEYKPVKVMVDMNYVGPVYETIYMVTLSKYVEDLPWSCRKELQMQKAIHLPLYLRLGSLKYVNWMEQKPNARKDREF